MSDNDVQELDKEFVINVRSPSLNETLIVTTKLSTTVLSLKELLRSIHPQKPNAEDQRIIYSGKLLQDNESLVDIIKKIDDEVAPIFHLVVKPSFQAIQSQNISTQQQPQPQRDINFTQPTTIASSSSIPLPEPISYTSFQNNDINLPAYPSVLPGGYQVVVINGHYYLAPVLVPHLQLQFQQNTHQPVYQQQQYQQQYQPQPPQYQPQQQQQQQQPQPPQQQQQEPIIQPYINAMPPQNNVNGGAAASIWLALKLAVVLFMLCPGASIERIFIFHTIAFIFFLYQTGRLRIVFRRVRVEDINNRFRGNNIAQRAPPPVPNQTPGQQQNNNAQGASTSVNNNGAADNLTQRRQNNEQGGSSSNTTSAEQPITPPTALDVFKRGAYTFLASLWPTYGQDPLIARAFENNNDQREGLEEF